MRAWSLVILALTFAVSTSPAATPPTAAKDLKGTPVTPARLPDGRPNWTGFWSPVGGMLEVYRGPSFLVGQTGNVNTRSDRNPRIPALKPEYDKMYEERLKQSAALKLFDPVEACFPPGMPRTMGMVYGMEILQTPNIIAITSEWQAESRRIWMDLKEHPPEAELDPSYSGHSIGRWEGDTLVVETVGIREDVPLDFTFLPHSPKLKVTERISEVAPGILVDDITVEDPDLFADGKKWTYSNTYRHRPDLRLGEFVCVENNRSITGKAPDR
jgi:hypothetical protein